MSSCRENEHRSEGFSYPSWERLLTPSTDYGWETAGTTDPDPLDYACDVPDGLNEPEGPVEFVRTPGRRAFGSTFINGGYRVGAEDDRAAQTPCTPPPRDRETKVRKNLKLHLRVS